jgi:cysteine protease ATG4
MQVARRISQVVANWLRWDDSLTTPVLFLGVEYQPEQSEAFLADWASRVWLSYRKNFVPIETEESTVVSDQGWGCMMRVTQMMLAQCQVQHRLGREWRFDPERDGAAESVYMEICRRFRDEPDARLSLHSFVARGKEVLGKKPSTWFGPTSGAQVGEALVNAERPDGLRACCFTDGVLYRKPILDALADGAAGVIVMLCRKLGVDAFNAQRYRGPVKTCFSSPHFMGLAGGGPMTSAYYFVAADDAQLYYLDPHTETRPAYTTDEEALALHAVRPLRLTWEALNPSMCLSFMVRSPEELEELAAFLSATDAELFEVMDEKQQYSASPPRKVNEEDEFLVLE